MGTKGARRSWILVLLVIVGALTMLGAVLSQVLDEGARRRTLAVSPSPSSEPVKAGGASPVSRSEAAAPADPVPDADEIPYGDHDIPRNDSIRGIVTDKAGEPVPDAVVLAVYKETRSLPYSLHLSARVRTEEDGFFVLGPLERRNYWVLAVHEEKGVGYAPDAMPGAWLDLALAPGASVKGTVTVAETGKPVAGATVILKDWVFYRETVTDALGRYLLAPLPATLNTWAGHQLVVAADEFKHAERTGLLLAGGHEYTIDFALTKGETLTGKVVDARSLEPVKDAVVGEGWEPYHKTTKTAEDGTYALENVEIQPNLVFTARAEGFLPLEQQSDATKTLDFAMSASLVVEGRILDPKDRPVEGARVYLHRIKLEAGFESASGNNRNQDFTTTSADGTFRFPNVLPGQVAVVAFHKDFAPGEKGPIDVPVGGPAPPGTDVLLRHGLTVEGIVRDTNDEPIPSVRVQMGRYGGQIKGYQYLYNYVWSESPVLYTDEEGRFTLKGGVPGQHWLYAWDRTYGWSGTQINGVEGERITDVVISFAGATISGVFLTSGGEPVPGASVQARGPKNGSRQRWGWTQTDGLGRFKLAGLEEGDYDITAWTAFGRPDPLKDVPAGSENVEIKLGVTQVLKGEVTSVLSGRALDRFHLLIQPVRKQGQPRSRRGSSWQGDLRSPDGRFERPVNPGEYNVIVKAAGHAPTTLEDVIVEENIEPQPLFVRLDQGGGVRGTATDRDGKPVPNAHVQVQIYRAPGEQAQPTDWMLGGNDRTDAKGRFFIQGLAPGTYLLTLNMGQRGSGQAQVVVRSSEMATQDLRLLPTGIVTIKAVDEEGKPVQGVMFYFRDEGGQWIGWAQQTNQQGLTTSQPLRMGPAAVQAYHSSYEMEPRSVTVVSDATVHLDVTLKKKSQ